MSDDDEFVGYKWEPQEFNVLSYVGDTLSFPIRLREKEAPQDYVDFDAFPCTFLAQVRQAADRDATLLKTLTVERTAQQGEVLISLPLSDLQAVIDGYWDFQVTWTTPPEEVITYLAGTFQISPKDVSNA